MGMQTDEKTVMYRNLRLQYPKPFTPYPFHQSHGVVRRYPVPGSRYPVPRSQLPVPAV